jgi:hypothetical protein
MVDSTASPRREERKPAPLRLRPFEAAAVLQCSVARVRALVREGVLVDIGLSFRIELDPDELVDLAVRLAARGEVSALSPVLARALAGGRLTVPKPRNATARPPSILALLGTVHASQSSQAASKARVRA